MDKLGQHPLQDPTSQFIRNWQAPISQLNITPLSQLRINPSVARQQNVWVNGRYVDKVQTDGNAVRMWQPGHYEQRNVGNDEAGADENDGEDEDDGEEER